MIVQPFVWLISFQIFIQLFGKLLFKILILFFKSLLQLEYIWGLFFYFFWWYNVSANANTSCARSLFFDMQIYICYLLVFLRWVFIWVRIFLDLHSHALGLDKSTLNQFLTFHKLFIILFLLLILWSTIILLFILLLFLFLHIGELIEMLFYLFRNASGIFWQFDLDMLVWWWFLQRLL